MTTIAIYPIMTKGNVFDPARYNRAIENAGNQTAKAIEADYKVTTRTWKHQPRFKITHTSGKWEWVISTDDAIYGYVSEGTREHPISPKRSGGFLSFFKTGFRAKTRSGWIGSNKGAAASKDFRRPMIVNHPGTKAREYPKTIKKKWDAEWGRQLERALRAATRYGG